MLLQRPRVSAPRHAVRKTAPVQEIRLSAAQHTTYTECQHFMHTLPDGQQLELLLQEAAQGAPPRAPLLFVHGSYHAAWCWAERFLPFFAARGHDAWAVSLRCQGGSSRPPGARVGGTMRSHAADVGSVVGALPRPPVLVCHSFGGLIGQCYLLDASLPPVAGAAFLCSVPPSGNSAMIGRFLRRAPLKSLRVTWAFVGRAFERSGAAAREAFFSDDLPDADLERYQARLAEASPVRLMDLSDVARNTPLPPLPPSAASLPRCVVGAADDAVVDAEAVEELGGYLGVAPVLLPRVAHDAMLDTRWGEAAGALAAFLDDARL